MKRIKQWISVAFAALFLVASSQAQAETKRLYVLGDSLAAGYGLPEEQGFTAQLEKALRAKGHDVKVINGGVSGDTTAGGRQRMAWALATKPHYVIVELGANDALRGLPPEEAKINLDAILTELSKRKVPTLLAGMYAPPNMGKAYTRAFEAMYPALAAKHGTVFYPFFLEGVANRRHLNQRDMIHPNAAGVKVIVEKILPSVEKLLARKPAVN
jgi:acyl-CoA thioesterase-1